MTHLPKVAEWVRFKRKSGSILLDNQQLVPMALYISEQENLISYRIQVDILNGSEKNLRFSHLADTAGFIFA